MRNIKRKRPIFKKPKWKIPMSKKKARKLEEQARQEVAKKVKEQTRQAEEQVKQTSKNLLKMAEIRQTEVLKERAKEMEKIEEFRIILLGLTPTSKKKFPKGMEVMAKIRSVEDAGRKKKIIEGLDVAEKIINRKISEYENDSRYSGNKKKAENYSFLKKKVREIKGKIKQEGLTPEVVKFFKEENLYGENKIVGSAGLIGELTKKVFNEFTSEELEYRFRDEVKKISPETKAIIGDKGLYDGERVHVPPTGDERKDVTYGSPLKMSIHLSTEETLIHELQHARNKKLGLELPPSDSFAHRNIASEFYPMLKTLNMGLSKGLFLVKFTPSYEVPKPHIHKPAAEYALIANKMGIKIEQLENLWERKRNSFSDSEKFSNAIFNELNWASNELKKKKLSEQEIKKKLREKLEKLKEEQ